MLSSPDYLILFVSALIGVGFDWLAGEPKRFHPLVGFGKLAIAFEQRLNGQSRWQQSSQRLTGLLGLLILILPWLGVAVACRLSPFTTFLLDTALLYFALGHKSLHQHAEAVIHALSENRPEQAKLAASYMVSRDSAAIEPIPATIESVLENGNDGVLGALFWFMLTGGVGALAFRLINTMDAMWGYKNVRYYYFGWAAARLDDVVSYFPARFTALTYALLGNTQTAWQSWQRQAPLWDSPNAGPVMASGAGAMQVNLGGPACYQGEWHQRPSLGSGRMPTQRDIARALALVRHGVWLWLISFFILSACMAYCNA